MCLKQRHPYYAIIILLIISYFFKNINKILLFVLSELAIIYGLFYAIWHVGVEKNILPGPASCSGKLSNTNSIQSLKEQINNQSIISCSDISWTIIGLSAATINSILLLLILIFNSIYIIQNFYDQKKINKKYN
jgi:disulfide bond formation protein DsbB